VTAPLQRASRDDDERSDEERLEGIRRLKLDIAISSSRELTALEDHLYKHVVECIDFDKLFGLEQLLWHLVDDLGHGALDEDAGLSHWLIRRAIVRAAHDPSTTCSDVPYGITKEEERAARFDAACPFCRYEAEHPFEDDEHDHDEEPCQLCDELARAWRAEHADALRRRGPLPQNAAGTKRL
jgi:hypothetical protein